MLKGQNPSRESILCHASQKSDFGALREARQIRDEGQAGGDRTMVHGGDIKYVTVLSNEHHLSPFLDAYQSTGVFSTLSLDPRKCSC